MAHVITAGVNVRVTWLLLLLVIPRVSVTPWVPVPTTGHTNFLASRWRSRLWPGSWSGGLTGLHRAPVYHLEDNKACYSWRGWLSIEGRGSIRIRELETLRTEYRTE